MTSSIDYLVNIVTSALPESVSQSAIAPLVAILNEKFNETQVEEFLKILEVHGADWGYQPSYPMARTLINTIIKNLFGINPILGLGHAKVALAHAQSGGQVVMVGNHLSYGDANYLHSQLELQGFQNFPLLVMAGPKVYHDPFRRLSSMTFETLRMAQPPSKASDGAEVSQRELVEITRRVMKDAETYQNQGRILYFFPEGSRSRSGDLNRFISASARYCNQPNTLVFPIGFSGTQGLIGVTGDRISTSQAQASIGPALSINQFQNELPSNTSEQRKVWMDILGYSVAAQLPTHLQGIYSHEEPKLEELVLPRQLFLQNQGSFSA